MTAKSDLWEAQILQLVFLNTKVTNGILDALNASLGAASNLSFALHDGDPGEAGSPLTNVLTYSGYADLVVARGSTNFEVVNPAGDQWLARNKIKLTFSAKKTDVGSVTATWASVYATSGATKSVLYKGLITTPSGGLVISQNTNPVIQAQAWTTEEK